LQFYFVANSIRMHCLGVYVQQSAGEPAVRQSAEEEKTATLCSRSSCSTQHHCSCTQTFHRHESRLRCCQLRWRNVRICRVLVAQYLHFVAVL